MTRIRRLLRQAAYRSGGLRLLRDRLRGTLTVVMFHRVLDRADPDFAGADPENMVSVRLFDAWLGFFTEHYNVIGLADLFAAADRRRPLPDYALLLTFDDGWADNLRYAAPLLKSRRLPAVVFIAAEPVLSPAHSWWQQHIFDAARSGTLAPALEKLPFAGSVASTPDDPGGVLDIVCRLAGLAESARARILASLPVVAPASRMMLAPDQVRELAQFGVAVGLHGYTHLPLTQVADLHSELRSARSAVVSLSGDPASACVLALPHGRYDQRVLTTARELGIRLVFTSDPVVNRVDGGMITEEQPLGRVGMEAPHLADRQERLDPGAAATWLWRRPIASGNSYRAPASGRDAG
jgi:peptidoglycan/xylan/chitin deacetylase (PgdA/CDA1 family)